MEALTYKCPNCGGGLVFDPKSGQFKCEFCLSKFTEEELKAHFPDMAAPDAEEPTQADAPDPAAPEDGMEHTLVYRCPSCGAEIVTDDTTAATFCYYCHNPIVCEGRLSGAFKPDLVVPFEIDRKQAEKTFLDWIGKRKFVPRDFFGKKQLEKMTGVYFPYWLTEASMEGKLDGTAQKVRVWIAGDIEYTETSTYRIHRAGDLNFKEYLSLAFRKGDQNLLNRILPYDMTKAVQFAMPYLSGFQAEKRDVEQTEAEGAVESTLRSYAEDLLRDSAGEYGILTGEQIGFTREQYDWKYCLLPVWLMTYRGKNDKMYYFALNAQTGEIVGELPLSGKRLASLFAGVMAAVTVIVTIGGLIIL